MLHTLLVTSSKGNPFETEVGKKIELATDADHLSTENWGLNMEICDYINYTENGGRDAVRAIRKRLQTHMGKNNGVVMYTLTVLETCVKNCNQRFKALICQKDFVNELVRLISAKFDAPQIVQERILGLIQAWSDAFRGQPALSGVFEVYDELKAKGVEFPPTNFDNMVPINTPKRTVFNDPPAQPEQQNQVPTNVPQSVAAHLSSAQQDPLSKLRADIDVTTVNLTVFRDLLADVQPGKEVPEELSLLEDLHTSLVEMQKRIQSLISAQISEDVTFELLTVNQEINNVFEKYTRHVAKRNGPSETPETEDNKQLREQLESFGVYEKKPGASTSTANEPEQQIDSLRSVAFDKPMLTDDQAKEVEDWLCLGEGSSTSQQAPPLPQKKKEDDGL
ncbi:hypothetical protein M3Y97_00900400 [Aphelenchoides bicaudatus]|nr:hypothetical protein M3Y97_00900400 [Aphelenchoides bicaudatus]